MHISSLVHVSALQGAIFREFNAELLPKIVIIN
jgi:hypothetical protein